MEQTSPTAQAITSAPELAAAIRATDHWQPHATWQRRLATDPLVAIYRVRGATVQEEAESAVYTIVHVMDRLRRLGAAYGEWAEFEAGAYFDLSYAQAARLVTVTERVATVHVIFYADVLLPSFQRVESFWSEAFRPMHRAMHTSLLSAPAMARATNGAAAFFDESQPELAAQWQQLLATIERIRLLLQDDPDFWSMSGATEERWRWRQAWQAAPARGLASVLCPPLESVPTLTLAYDFPLPAHRQPGRLRRLRRQREERTRGRRPRPAVVHGRL